MAVEKIRVVGDSVVMTLSKSILEQLGLENGDEVNVSVIDKTLVVRSMNEVERARKFQEITDEVFTEYADVFKALAVGVE